MALNSSIAHTDAVAVFLASKPQCGLSPDVYTAVKATAAVPACPPLPYRQTAQQLDPDPREKAVEFVLAAASDYDDLPSAVVVLAAMRPDLDRGDVLNAVHALFDLSEDTFRAESRGDWVIGEAMADRYENVLADLAHAPVSS